MVPFYGTVYKSILYDLIIPFPACEAGAEREKRRAVVFASGNTEKSEQFNYKFFMDSFLCGMAPIIIAEWLNNHSQKLSDSLQVLPQFF